MTTEETDENKSNNFELGKLEACDIDDLMNVARQWVKWWKTGEVDEEELASIKERMEGSLNNNGYTYFVIRDNTRRAIGMCAIREPEDKMQQYKASPSTNSAELVNLFLDNAERGKGLGMKLMEFCFSQAKKIGFEEIIWNSGPRYKNSAWDFYTKLVGKPFTTAVEFYGENGDAPVWRVSLSDWK
ncbi:MAG: GNAT family N-acetyltransferase [Atribacterota bacterium]|nr:GNAT family N-acetyltransferase [Atribacterota bacterium]